MAADAWLTGRLRNFRFSPAMDSTSARSIRRWFLLLTGLACLALMMPQLAWPQEDEDPPAPADSIVQATPTTPRAKPERELIWVGLASYGNYNLFAIEDMTKLYTSGVEYDRHSWGYFIGAQMDYVAEFLPFVLLIEPAKSDFWGNPKSSQQKLVPGIGVTPIGLRMMWRSHKAIKPYILVKGGMLGFTQKALSTHASYENYSLQSGFGLQTRLTDRVDLRLGLWGDFHFSNGFMAPSNPGTDVMNANWGISYHLGSGGPRGRGTARLLKEAIFRR